MIVSFDENVQEMDCTVLFELNDEFDIWVTVIEVVQKNWVALFLLSNKVKVSSTYRNQTEGKALLLETHFSSKWPIKMLIKTGP